MEFIYLSISKLVKELTKISEPIITYSLDNFEEEWQLSLKKMLELLQDHDHDHAKEDVEQLFEVLLNHFEVDINDLATNLKDKKRRLDFLSKRGTAREDVFSRIDKYLEMFLESLEDHMKKNLTSIARSLDAKQIENVKQYVEELLRQFKVIKVFVNTLSNRIQHCVEELLKKFEDDIPIIDRVARDAKKLEEKLDFESNQFLIRIHSQLFMLALQDNKNCKTMKEKHSRNKNLAMILSKDHKVDATYDPFEEDLDDPLRNCIPNLVNGIRSTFHYGKIQKLFSIVESLKNMKFEEIVDVEIATYPSRYYELNSFMKFFIEKVQEEDCMEEIWPLVAKSDQFFVKNVQKNREEFQKQLIAICLHLFVKESIDSIVSYVLESKLHKTKLHETKIDESKHQENKNGEGKLHEIEIDEVEFHKSGTDEGELCEAKKLLKVEEDFKAIFKHMKPSDITNRSWVYNYALQKATVPIDITIDQIEVEDPVEIYGFFTNLFVKDEVLWQQKDQLTFQWIEQHDYPYMIRCMWECYQKVGLDASKLCINDDDWRYALHAAASTSQRTNIIEDLFRIRCKLNINARYNGVTPLHAAALKGHEKVVEHLLKRKELDINALTKNEWKGLQQAQTALHIAVEHGHVKVLKVLCQTDHIHLKILRCHEEDCKGLTPLAIFYEKLNKFGATNEEASLTDVDNTILSILWKLDDIQKGVDRLYRDRQVHVDATNTILVGAALIAGVTFGGWLQPPLGYSEFYEYSLAHPAPPNTYESYLDIQGHSSVQAFAVFNSLSFFFAVATVIVGADTSFPMNKIYIGKVVKIMQIRLRLAIKFVIISMVCVIGAFASAGVAILPPNVYFRKHLVSSILIGIIVCSIVVWQLLSRHSYRIRYFNKRMFGIIQKYISYSNIF